MHHANKSRRGTLLWEGVASWHREAGASEIGLSLKLPAISLLALQGTGSGRGNVWGEIGVSQHGLAAIRNTGQGEGS